jgi:predicted nucleotidyltransferase component of viral defense system
MDYDQLIKYVKEIGIAKDQILREEAEMEILENLAEDKLGAKVVFYGGTALRLAYGSPRFSEDIDLICRRPVNFSEFSKFAKDVAQIRPGWSAKDIKDKRQTMFALISVKDEKLKHSFSVKIEVHKPAKKIKLETEIALLKSPVSIAEPLLLVPVLAELKRLKEDALLRRKKARDVFDLWYISQIMRQNFSLPKAKLDFKEREFKNELQVFLPRKFYPIINQLYAKMASKN